MLQQQSCGICGSNRHSPAQEVYARRNEAVTFEDAIEHGQWANCSRKAYANKYVFKGGDHVKTPKGKGRVWNVQYYARSETLVVTVIIAARMVTFYNPSELELYDAE